jgi:pimeloyl-ACP methyl ester carboxylesterase
MSLPALRAVPLVLADGPREAFWSGPLPGSAPTIVLLHEGLGSARQWRGLPDELARATGCGVLAYSRRGYGASPALAGPLTSSFMHEAAADELPRVLEVAGVRDVVLLGHSDGGSIALIAAAGASLPARLLSVIVEAPHVIVEDETVRSIAALQARWKDDATLRARFARHHAHADTLVPAWTEIWLSPAFREWDITPLLPKVRVPVLAIGGDRDEYGTRRQLDLIEKAVAGPRRIVWLEGVGHAPHRDEPARVLEEVGRFVRP